MGLQGYFDNCVNPILCLVLYWLFSLVSFFSRSVEGGEGGVSTAVGGAASVGYDTA